MGKAQRLSWVYGRKVVVVGKTSVVVPKQKTRRNITSTSAVEGPAAYAVKMYRSRHVWRGVSFVRREVLLFRAKCEIYVFSIGACSKWRVISLDMVRF